MSDAPYPNLPGTELLQRAAAKQARLFEQCRNENVQLREQLAKYKQRLLEQEQELRRWDVRAAAWRAERTSLQALINQSR